VKVGKWINYHCNDELGQQPGAYENFHPSEKPTLNCKLHRQIPLLHDSFPLSPSHPLMNDSTKSSFNARAVITVPKLPTSISTNPMQIARALPHIKAWFAGNKHLRTSNERRKCSMRKELWVLREVLRILSQKTLQSSKPEAGCQMFEFPRLESLERQKVKQEVVYECSGKVHESPWQHLSGKWKSNFDITNDLAPSSTSPTCYQNALPSNTNSLPYENSFSSSNQGFSLLFRGSKRNDEKIFLSLYFPTSFR
jgi:hypothetical protein